MSNTEMRYMGQEGFVSDDDNRAAVFILNADNTTTRPIYIRNCAFHDLYAGAIAVVGSADIEITNNVVHHTVGTGLCGPSWILSLHYHAILIWKSFFLGKRKSLRIRFKHV